jgi:hypothetical protein
MMSPTARLIRNVGPQESASSVSRNELKKQLTAIILEKARAETFGLLPLDPMPGPLNAQFDQIITDLVDACRQHYGDRLVSVAIFGSVGRGTPRPDSDVDVLIVAEELPRGRVARAGDFCAVEATLAPRLKDARRAGLTVPLSPVFKTPAEVAQGSPLLLDMTEDARIVYDRAGFLAQTLARLRSRLAASGARRIWKGNAWIWDLKPDYQPGDEFEL